ncbi:UNVERIFIED_CONTAM: hypothetical protein ABIE34_000154 [Jeotgalibacillus campisalis]
MRRRLTTAPASLGAIQAHLREELPALPAVELVDLDDAYDAYETWGEEPNGMRVIRRFIDAAEPETGSG